MMWKTGQCVGLRSLVLSVPGLMDMRAFSANLMNNQSITKVAEILIGLEAKTNSPVAKYWNLSILGLRIFISKITTEIRPVLSLSACYSCFPTTPKHTLTWKIIFLMAHAIIPRNVGNYHPAVKRSRKHPIQSSIYLLTGKLRSLCFYLKNM